MAGYTKFDNPILEKVLTSSFTKRQLKILLLIIRFSSGCQKTYAVLRKNNYAYAGVSPYCITNELEKLVKLRVIKWDAKRDLVWLNPRLSEWTVDKPGEKLRENLRRFFKIANKNLLKWQLTIYQNNKSELTKTAKISSVYKEKKEIVNKNYSKEDTFLRILSDYFLRVAPLSEEETFILREIARSYNPKLLEEAITLAAQGEAHSLSEFLKALDALAHSNRPRGGGLSSLRSRLKLRLKTASRI